VDIEMKEIIKLGNGFTIQMNLYDPSPRRYTLLLGDVELAYGKTFNDRYDRYDRYDCGYSEYEDQKDVEFPITYYVAPSNRSFVNQIMNKFRAERKAAREASFAKSAAEAEQARLAKEGDAILAIRKFKKENKERRWL
jgi:hypothetical protein